jgi:hydrogenase maturation protease
MNGHERSAAAAPGQTRVLVIGYGNPGRQDDGLGPAVAAEIDKLGRANLTVFDNYQLNIEDAIDVAEHDVVWFVDAAKVGPSPFAVTVVECAFAVDFTSHLVRPEVVLALSQQYYQKAPKAFLLGVRGFEFAFVEELTAAAANNMRLAVSMLTDRICTTHPPGPP